MLGSDFEAEEPSIGVGSEVELKLP